MARTLYFTQDFDFYPYGHRNFHLACKAGTLVPLATERLAKAALAAGVAEERERLRGTTRLGKARHGYVPKRRAI
jgi:hypothetical protein